MIGIYSQESLVTRLLRKKNVRTHQAMTDMYRQHVIPMQECDEKIIQL
jgi:hypothetical protein